LNTSKNTLKVEHSPEHISDRLESLESIVRDIHKYLRNDEKDPKGKGTGKDKENRDITNRTNRSTARSTREPIREKDLLKSSHRSSNSKDRKVCFRDLEEPSNVQSLKVIRNRDSFSNDKSERIDRDRTETSERNEKTETLLSSSNNNIKNLKIHCNSTDVVLSPKSELQEAELK